MLKSSAPRSARAWRRLLPPAAAVCAALLAAAPAAAQQNVRAPEPEQREKELAEKPAPALLSAAAARVTGLSGEHVPGGARITEVRRLSRRLSADDVRALLTFISGERPPELERPLWHALVNDIEDALLRQERPAPGIYRHLTDSARTQRDPVLRDYALQKLGNLFSPPPSAALKAEMLAALTEAAALEGEHLQGTALLSWARALGAKGAASDPAFRKAVLACLSSARATAPARLTALQAAAEAGFEECAPFARALLADPGAPVAVKLSAAAALGKTGERARDSALLSSLSADPALGPAAAAALKRLSARP